jgi:hypothetical protein
MMDNFRKNISFEKISNYPKYCKENRNLNLDANMFYCRSKKVSSFSRIREILSRFFVLIFSLQKVLQIYLIFY